MFTAKEIKELIEAKPFKPFKIYLSDGTSYEISNHDMAMVSKNAVYVGIHPDPDSIAERFVRCALLHITKIEELQPA